MRFMPGKVSLSDVGGGTLGSGVVPLPRCIRTEVEDIDTAGHVVPAVLTTILTVDLGTVVAGDVIDLYLWCRGTKGAAAGGTWFELIQHAGTATVDIPAVWSGISFEGIGTHPLGVQMIFGKSVSLDVSVGGTATLRIDCISWTSNLTITGNQAFLRARVWAGS